MTLTTRLAVAMIALVAIAVSAVGWLSYRSLEQMIPPRILDRTETHSRLVASDLQSHERNAPADIASFRYAAALNGLIRGHLAGGIDPIDGVTEKTWHQRIAQRQPVRHHHCQCRHAAGLRPRPVIGAARRKDLRRQQTRRLSRSPRRRARIQLGAGRAGRLDG